MPIVPPVLVEIPESDLNDPILLEARQWGECVDKILSNKLTFKNVVVRTYTNSVIQENQNKTVQENCINQREDSL